jgi:hypothetical protein
VRVEVLDHLDDRRCVEARQPGVPVGEGAVQEPDLLAPGLRQPVELEPGGGALKRPVGDVHADDLLEARLPDQRLGRAASSGRSLLRPFIAVPNTSAMATLVNDDDT